MDGLGWENSECRKGRTRENKKQENNMNTDIWFLLDFHNCLHAAYMVPLPLLT